MKFFILFTVVLALSLAKVGFAAQLTDNQLTQNVAGDTIVIVDEPSANDANTSNWQSKTQEILINAMSLTGIKYKYGGNSPETGFDCSGFVRYVFQNAVNLALPPTARAISQIGQNIKKDELQPGDLVFFNTLKSAYSHVGIYLGDNKFIHAPSAGKTVRIENMQSDYWAKRFNGAQRLDKEAANATN